jgi:hypothetical protein
VRFVLRGKFHHLGSDNNRTRYEKPRFNANCLMTPIRVEHHFLVKGNPDRILCRRHELNLTGSERY